MTGRRVPAVYRWLLRLLPAEFRAHHQDELARTCIDQLEGLGRLRRASVWTRASVDTLQVAVVVNLQRLGARSRRGMRAFGGARQDLRFAVRSLSRRPAAAAVPILTLAIGIGGTTTIFSVVNGVLLQPLPYAAADRIGILWHEFGDGAQNLPALHPLDLYDYRARSEMFDQFTLATGREWVLGDRDTPELVDVGFVEANFFDFFGAAPALGRTFAAAEDRPGGPRVVVLSHRLWERRFGSDPLVVDRMIDLEGQAWRVIGVLPPSFRLHLPAEAFRLRDAEMWVPVAVDETTLPPRNYTGFTGFARLQAGRSFAEAQHELESLAATLRAEHAEHDRSHLRARVEPLHADVVKAARDRLVLLQGAVAVVLLIACANVANLLLVRGRSRAMELAVRAALGAGAGRLVRLILIESLLLASLGGLAGVLVAVAAVRVIAALGRQTVPLVEGAAVDVTVLVFAAVASMASAVAFGVLPALQALRQHGSGTLTHGARATGSPLQARLRDGLVVSEIALSVMLLIAAGLMIRSFVQLSAVDPGYATDGAITFTVSLPGSDFPDAESRSAFYDRLDERLSALPGVAVVAGISQLPLAGSGPLQPYAYDAETAERWESVTADQRSITPGFFDAIGATLVAGRDFTPAEVRSGAPVIIVDDRLAARAFPEDNPIGQRLQIEPNGTPEAERFAEVVGVVRHLRLHDLSRPHLTQIYFPAWPGGRRSIVVQVLGDPALPGDAIRREVAALAPGASIDDVQTMASAAREARAPARFSLVLMIGFGTASLLLAAIGIYGVLAHSVSQRTREFGVRIALGQAPADVRRQVLWQGARLVGAAMALGLAGAMVAGQTVSHLLFGVDPLDPATFASAGVTLAVVSLVACWIPATRATRIDPIAALRSE